MLRWAWVKPKFRQKAHKFESRPNSNKHDKKESKCPILEVHKLNKILLRQQSLENSAKQLAASRIKILQWKKEIVKICSVTKRIIKFFKQQIKLTFLFWSTKPEYVVIGKLIIHVLLLTRVHSRMEQESYGSLTTLYRKIFQDLTMLVHNTVIIRHSLAGTLT